MQSFPQYGLSILLQNSNYQNEYMELKSSLEDIGRLASKAPPCIRAVLLSDDTHWLTVYATGNSAWLGIYNNQTNQISQNLSFNSPVILKKDCDSLKHKVELFIKNRIPMHHRKIENAWESFLEEHEKSHQELNKITGISL